MDQRNGIWSSALSMHASTCEAWKTLTRLFHILIHNHQMLVPPPCCPPCNPPHLEPLSFLPPHILSARKYAHNLIAEIIRCFRCFWRRCDEYFWWGMWIVRKAEIGSERIGCKISVQLFDLYRRRRLFGCWQHRWIMFACIIECPGNIFCNTFL